MTSTPPATTLKAIAESINDASDTTSKPVYFYDRYQPYLTPLQHQPVRMLELGVHKGESLKTFASFFANGHIVGVDIQNYGLDLSGYPNAVFEHGDQRNGTQLNALTDKHAPDGWDIVIDDASHYGSWSMLTYQALYPRLKPGGLYIVEDWQTAYWDDWPDGSRYQQLATPVPEGHIPPRVPSHDAGMAGFLKYLVDELVARPATTRNSHISNPAKFDWMNINDTFAILKKAGGV